MTRLAFALAAVTMLAGVAPASAQAIYPGVSFGPGWNGGPWGAQSGNWGWGGGPYVYGPSVGFYGAAPAAETYVYRPRRARRVVRTRAVSSNGPAYAAYASDPYYSYGGPYIGVGGSSFGVGVGFGSGYGYRGW